MLWGIDCRCTQFVSIRQNVEVRLALLMDRYPTDLTNGMSRVCGVLTAWELGPGDSV